MADDPNPSHHDAHVRMPHIAPHTAGSALVPVFNRDVFVGKPKPFMEKYIRNHRKLLWYQLKRARAQYRAGATVSELRQIEASHSHTLTKLILMTKYDIIMVDAKADGSVPRHVVIMTPEELSLIHI